MTGSSVEIVEARVPADLGEVRTMFREYASSLSFDLSFQDFAFELANLPGCYAAPQGVILLAVVAGKAVGCVAVRPFPEDGVCEMKRLYVRHPYRNKGVGRRLALASVEHARRIGYAAMRLDTAPCQGAAWGRGDEPVVGHILGVTGARAGHSGARMPSR